MAWSDHWKYIRYGVATLVGMAATVGLYVTWQDVTTEEYITTEEYAAVLLAFDCCARSHYQQKCICG